MRRDDITVAVSLVAADDVHIPGTHLREWEPTEEAYACIEVSDTGCGMDSETLERIFDPFFSTKFTGRGLGLPVVLGAVKAHDGAVAVESEPGRGAVFRIYLPLSTEQPRPSPVAAAVAPEPPGERGLVLVVEDEPATRKMAQTMLKRLGWEVVTAATASRRSKYSGNTRTESNACFLISPCPAWAAGRPLRPCAPFGPTSR